MENVVEKALLYATHAHSGQMRKYSSVPYILHPAEAAAIASTVTDDPEIIAAVLLHDTVEDTDVTLEDIRREFGDRIAAIVSGDTEVEDDEIPRSESWMNRKQASLENLRNSSRDVKIMWLSDKLSNTRSFCRLFRAEGDAMWDHFNQKDKKIQEWYYRLIEDYLSELQDTDAYKEYCSRVDYLFGGNSHEEYFK